MKAKPNIKIGILISSFLWLINFFSIIKEHIIYQDYWNYKDFRIWIYYLIPNFGIISFLIAMLFFFFYSFFYKWARKWFLLSIIFFIITYILYIHLYNLY